MINKNNPFIIKSEPCKTLEECLNSMSPDQLEYMISQNFKIENFLEVGESKTEQVRNLKKVILKKIKYAFLYKPPVFRAFLVTIMLGKDPDEYLNDLKVEMDKNGFGKDQFEYLEDEIIDFLFRNGFVYSFLPKKSGKLTHVVPVEIIQAFAKSAEKLLIDESKDETGKYYDFAQYANLLSSLYGVCPVEQFLEIYNRDFKQNKVTDKKLAVKYLKEAADLSGDFVYSDNAIEVFSVHALKIRNLIEKGRADFKPYIPSKKELSEKYSNIDYNDDNEAKNALFDFFDKKNIPNVNTEFAVFQIINNLQISLDVKEIMNIVNNLEINFRSTDEANQFLNIVTDINNTMHHWTRWGHIPQELTDKVYGKNQKKSVLSEAAIEKEELARENRLRIDLPEDCKIPTEKELKETKAALDDYWDSGEEPEWFSIGDAQLRRISSFIGKFKSKFADIEEENFNRFVEQWIASIWHKSANRGNGFGDTKWDYHAFTVGQKLKENLFACMDSNGKPFVVYSPSVQMNYEENSFTCLCVLIDVGGFFMTYGPVMSWKGLVLEDFEYLAQKTAGQMYESQGLSAVIQFNPVPFWISTNLGNIPPIGHKGKEVLYCELECAFKNNKIPDFQNDSICNCKWKKEETQNGKLIRWIDNKDDYLSSTTVYYDSKTQKVLISSYNKDLFDKLLEQVKNALIIKKKPSICSMVMLTEASSLFKEKKLLEQFESKFLLR